MSFVKQGLTQKRLQELTGTGSIRRFHGIPEDLGVLVDFPHAGSVGSDTDYKPRSTS
jgi:hypothetical protein